MTIEGTEPQVSVTSHKSPVQRMAGVLFAPAETFEDIARRPDVLVALLTIIVISYVSIAVTMPRMDFESLYQQQAEQMRARNPNIDDETLERTQRFTRAITTTMAWVGPGLMVAWYAIVAGVLLMLFRMFGHEGTYRQAFSAVVYAWMPLILFSVISTIVVFARGTFDPVSSATLVKSNPAFLVDLKEHPVLFSMLSSFDVFTIWTVVLLVFGFAALAKSTRARAAVIVVSAWLVTIVIKVGFAAMGAGMSS